MIGDGITINRLHSYHSFSVLMKTRNIGIPLKKEIRDSVPFMNGSYDFSELYGEGAYEDRKLNYIFNYKKKDKKSVNEFSIKFMKWIVQKDIEIYDDCIEGYHFIGTSKVLSYTDREKIGTIEVEFTCYPFKISNHPTIHSFKVTKSNDVIVKNDGFHRVTPIVICENEMNITMDDIKFTFLKGTNKDDLFQFPIGESLLKIEGTGSIRFEFFEEVL